MQDTPSSGLHVGVYDEVITKEQESQLAMLPSALHVATKELQSAEYELISQRIQEQINIELQRLSSVDLQLQFANKVIESIRVASHVVSGSESSPLTNAVLQAIFESGDVPQTCRPDTPLAENAIFTAGMRELALGPQLVKEILTSNEVFLLVSFIRQTGLNVLWDALTQFTQLGGRLHVLTSTYMRATQLSAIDRLTKLPNTDIAIAFDSTTTRLHAKAYVFRRDTGYHTAYVGSSNITNPALTDGLEWNVKISAVASPKVFNVINSTVDAYLHDPQFERYVPAMREKLAKMLTTGPVLPSHGAMESAAEIVPFRYQETILERLQAEREIHGANHNLVVAATGTGKTVIAAFDYKRFTEANLNSRLLFVAHRQEILEQARETFRNVLGDSEFGSLQVGEHQAANFEHLFISIQSANSLEIWNTLESDFYDYIVVDEFHHAAALSYKKLLGYFTPQVLLGLTATPERRDGQDILQFFGGRIAAEIRLPQAIDQGLLCPFQYFGLPDTVDLDQVKWTRGGYDLSGLEQVYVFNAAIAQRRAQHVLREFKKRVDLATVRALGFCVSVAHAKFMADFFCENGTKAAVVSGQTSSSERHRLRNALENGDLSVIFCVDVFNEGVDIPALNTILLLRPTESLTVYVQQLGRGLRLHPGKDSLLVLDFIGNANRNYRFEEKFASLLRKGANIRDEVNSGFIHLPRGCFIELQAKPRDIVLQSIARGFSNTKALIERIEQYVEDNGSVPTIADFLSYYKLSAQEVYKTNSFDALLRAAGYVSGPIEPLAKQLNGPKKGLLRLSYIDSYRWLRRVLDLLKDLDLDGKFAGSLSADDGLILGMLFTSIWPTETIPEANTPEFRTKFAALAQSPRLLKEMQNLLDYQAKNVETMSIPLDIGTPCPLDIHSTYTRNQLLAAVRYRNPRGMQTGVLWVPELNADVLLVTLRKNESEFSENTMYKDYAIDATTFHWQTQNDTDVNSAVGQRYVHHTEQGSHVLLFVRVARDDAYGRMPYQFLGPAEYVSSSGNKPVSIIWKLKYRLSPSTEAELSRIVV